RRGRDAERRPSPDPYVRGAPRPPWSEVDRRQLRLTGTGGPADAELLEQNLLDLGSHVRVLLQEGAGVLLALPELVPVVGVPGARLADDPVLDPHVEERPLARDALPVQDVHLRLFERTGHLVLDDLDPGAVAHDLGAVLEALDPAHVEAD